MIALIAILFFATACADPAPASVVNYGPGSGEATTPPAPPGLPPEAFDETKYVVNEAEAISIASQHVPAEVAAHAKIVPGKEVYGNYNTGEIHFAWEVIFMDISVTRAWLGWVDDGQQTILQGQEPYNEIVVRLDAVTGEFTSRTACFAMQLGGPGYVPPTVTPWTPAVSDNASE